MVCIVSFVKKNLSSTYLKTLPFFFFCFFLFSFYFLPLLSFFLSLSLCVFFSSFSFVNLRSHLAISFNQNRIKCSSWWQGLNFLSLFFFSLTWDPIWQFLLTKAIWDPIWRPHLTGTKKMCVSRSTWNPIWRFPLTKATWDPIWRPHSTGTKKYV